MVLGAGAVGGVLGARLAQAGRDVVLVARGEHLAAMRRNGLRLRTPQEDVTVGVELAEGPEDVILQTGDVLVATAKTQQLGALLVATNGVAADDLALRYFARVAHGHGLSAPINSRLATLGRHAAATGHRTGDLSPAELAAALGLAARAFQSPSGVSR